MYKCYNIYLYGVQYKMYIATLSAVWYNVGKGGDIVEPKTTKAQQRATAKYKRENYDNLHILVPKGQKDQIKNKAAEAGESLNAYACRAILAQMEGQQSTGNSGEGQQEAQEGACNAFAVSLPSETYKAATEAAEMAGEDLAQFVARAIAAQADMDRKDRSREQRARDLAAKVDQAADDQPVIFTGGL